MASLYFSCTLCGNCCHNHSLPLTMLEAIAWLEDGGTVAIYCEAIPAASEPTDARAEHRKKRSFSVPCGASQLYVTAILVAEISGACRNLDADMKCRIYERRPLVCRIYPAEVNPFIQLDPAHKVCPPEAWLPNEPLNNYFAESLPSRAERWRQIDYQEAARKARVCADLEISTTALADEGYVRHIHAPERLLTALKTAYGAKENPHAENRHWVLLSPALAKGNSELEVISEKEPLAGYSFLRA